MPATKNCPTCGKENQSGGMCYACQTAQDALDDLVARASVPNLASLYRAGKERGLIAPMTKYANT